MPGVVGEYVREQEQKMAEERVAKYIGARYEGIGADVYDYAREERERSPSASVREVYEVAADRLIGDIRKYDEAGESEIEEEARAEREAIHINQFHARYESPSPDASEYTQNIFAEESEAFVERQLWAVDRQLPDATEVEKLRITENNLGLEHRASERIQNAYESQAERDRIRENAFDEGLSVTRSHLEEVYFNNKTSNGWNAYLAKSESWSIAEERGFVEKVSHRENRFIALSQGTPGSKYATDESYRHGAREAVRQFSHEHNHRLKEKESEQPRETNRESIRIKFG